MLSAIQRPYDSYLPVISKPKFRPLEDAQASGDETTSRVPQEPDIGFKTDYDEPKHSSCQKLLFSATLTSDPGKIALLGLRNPKYFVVRETVTGAADDRLVVSESFSMPTNLTVGLGSTSSTLFLKLYVKEHMIVCTSSQKPLILFYLVRFRRVDSALVFTKSAESTTRLVKLFELFEEISPTTVNQKFIVRSYSSDLPPSERKSILEQFKEKKIGV